MPIRPREIHSLERLVHRGERFGRAILGGGLSFEPDPEFVALLDLGQTVDGPEAYRADRVSRSFRRLLDVAAGTLAGHDEAHRAQVGKRLPDHGA